MPKEHLFLLAGLFFTCVSFFTPESLLKNLQETVFIHSPGKRKPYQKQDVWCCPVIYHGEKSHSHYLWIALPETFDIEEIGIHSTVLHEGVLLGIIDYIKKNHARVRLLTNPKLEISIKFLSHQPQLAVLSEKIEQITFLIENGGLSHFSTEPLLLDLERLEKEINKEKIPPIRYGFLKGLFKDSLQAIVLKASLEDVGNESLEKGRGVVTAGLEGTFKEGIPIGYTQKSVSSNKEEVIIHSFLPLYHKISSVEVLPPPLYKESDIPSFLRD